MRMIHTYEEFCECYDRKVKIRIQLEDHHVSRAEAAGWTFSRFRKKRDFLRYCRDNRQNFETAYTDWGVDFWHPPTG